MEAPNHEITKSRNVKSRNHEMWTHAITKCEITKSRNVKSGNHEFTQSRNHEMWNDELCHWEITISPLYHLARILQPGPDRLWPGPCPMFFNFANSQPLALPRPPVAYGQPRPRPEPGLVRLWPVPCQIFLDLPNVVTLAAKLKSQRHQQYFLTTLGGIFVES